MTVADEFALANVSYVQNLASDRKGLPLPPARKVLVLTCMDARIHPAQSLGLKEGDAHVVRNAGGRASDALRSIVISQQLLGTKEIVVLHHTDCGMLTFQDNSLRDKLKENPPKPNAPIASTVESIAFLAFSNLDQSVKDDVSFLKEHPLVLPETVITGWIHDVKDGSIKQVV
ncbi:carbonic anhydrase [Cantharellus anzutake]|uniref:carbonic anhydrase n=1 Tax=Cantharellus anzutake TaxID=1750568 RepID=UPI001904364A|nr:carbonic anhydrase [Cantharellus anzutake]KAF8334127.1 carbonic anhydrase [Cantharellus anzutake]